MMATGEAQTMAPQLDSLELARLLRRRLAGEPFPHSFIHDVEACSVAPEELVRGRAPGADQGDGKGMAWYFYGPVNCDGESAWRRRRHVGSGGGAGRRCWHPETGKRPILCPDKKSAVAYKRTLSYVLKIKNLPVKTKSFRNKRLGWCMIEISLKKRDDDGEDQQRVLCKVYKPPRTDPETSMEASSAGGQGVVPAAICAVSEGGVTQDESLDLPGSDAPLPTPASGDYNLHPPGVAPNPALFIGPGNDMPPPPASGHHSLHPLGPGVVQSPVISIGPAPQYGTQCWPGGKVLSRVAIVKKADVASCGAVTVVMKFGSSSIPSAERIKEMAKLVLDFPSEKGEIRAVVLSEVGNTTNNILMAVWKALRCGDKKASEIHEFFIIKELYRRTIDELGLHTSIVSGPLDKLEHHLQHVAITKELTPRTRDFLVSFGGHTCTEMFSAYLNKLGKGTPQEWELRVVTTSGSGSSDLTATTIGKTLGLRQIQVWKDVDGILTCDPKVNTMATLVPYLTFDEAAELSYFGEQSMQLAMEAGMSVIVKNSYKPQAAGTMITKTRDMSKSTSTIIVLKSNITMLDIVSISMLSRNDFVAKAFSIFQEFEDLGISVDFVAEGKMSFTLVPSKLLSQESIQLGLDNVVEELKKIASVELLHHRSVISMIGNTQMAALILHKAVNVLRSIKIEAQKVLQWSSKLVTKITLVVDDSEGEHCVQALHSALVELNDDVRVDSSMMAGSSSGSGSGVKKRKAAGDGHPGGSKGLLQENAYSTEPSTSVVGRPTVPGNDPIIPVEDIDDYDLQSLLATLSSPYNDQTPIGNLDWNFPLLYDDGAEALHSCVPLPAHISRPEMLRQIVVGDRHHDTTGTNYMTPEGTDRLFSPYNNPMPRRIRFDQKLDSMVLPQSGCNYGPSRVSTPEPEELFTPPEHPEVSLSIAGSLAKELFAAIRWLAGCWATCRERIGV